MSSMGRRSPPPRELGALNRDAHRATKLRIREEVLAGVRDGIERIESSEPSEW